jgi:hypothetical protein
MNYKKVLYDNKFYAVIGFNYKSNIVPVVIDYDDLAPILALKKKNWKCHSSGFVSFTHTISSKDGALTGDIYLHELIILQKNKNENIPKQSRAILHINRLGLDNRRQNLMYDNVNKETHKNIKKKRRTVELPADSGINPDEIPTYVWYLKPDATHGDRFVVDIGSISWKTTSSKQFTLKYKLEEAKTFLRSLKKHKPELFADYCMNGEYTKDGKDLLNSFYQIIDLAGYNNIKKIQTINLTDLYLKENPDSLKNKYIIYESESESQSESDYESDTD